MSAYAAAKKTGIAMSTIYRALNRMRNQPTSPNNMWLKLRELPSLGLPTKRQAKKSQ